MNMRPVGYRAYTPPPRTAIRSSLLRRAAPTGLMTGGLRYTIVPPVFHGLEDGFGGVLPPMTSKNADAKRFFAWLKRRAPSLSRQLGRGGMGAIATGATGLVTDLANAYKEFLAQKAAIEGAKAQAKIAQAQAAAATRPAPVYDAPTYGGSLMAQFEALPLPVKLGGVAALGYLGFTLLSGRGRGRRGR